LEAWLHSIGLGEHAPAFAANRITEDQIHELTEADLRELGLTIGERKIFLRARAERRNAAAPRPSLQAERRPLTVMFVDVLDSTGLAERLGDEDYAEAIRRYREFAIAAMHRFGGRLARFVGDGILAYFCYPVANENDPERAVRAALAITAGIGEVKAPAGTILQLRVGLATGRVLVSELFGGEPGRDQDVFGSVPNLAARLQALAPPNGIVISESTYARVQRHFVCASIGPTHLRGFDQPHEPRLVHGEAARHGAHDVLAEQRLTPFSNRESELDILRALWRKANEGEDSTVLILGEPGIGKSRLITQFCTTEIEPEQKTLRFAATAFEEDSPLSPFMDYLVEEAGLSRAEPPATTLARLQRFLGAAVDDEHAAAILATLVGVGADDPAVASLLPEQLRQRTIAILVEYLLFFAHAQPLCIVVEDLHWLDPTSRDLLQALRTAMRGRRAMLLLTAREWAGRADTTLRLKRLPAEHVSAMIRNLFGAAVMTSPRLEYVASKTDGVPLYVEEVARLMLQRLGLGGRADDAAGPLQQEVPASLDELLMAALDRAGTAKELAQVASVIGDEVRRDVLASLSGLDDRRLSAELAELVSRGIFDPAGRNGDEVFRFHHALLRDVAYMSMVRDRRRALHAQAAKALQLLEPDLPATHPELLALHLAEGGLIVEAAPHWLEAARRSLARSALTEASRVLRRGLTALEGLAQTPEVMSLRLQFSALLGPALISLKGPNAAETQELYTKAYELGHLLPEEPAHFPIYWGWWRLDTASEARAQALLDRAKAKGDPGLLLQAHHCCWNSYMNRGELGLCCDHIDAGMAIYGEGAYREHARLYGNHDAKACAHGILAQTLWMQGRLAAALEHERAGLRWADDMDHLGTRVHARGMALLHRAYRRDYEVVLAQADELGALTGRHGMEGAGAAALIFRGWAIALLGEPEAGLRQLEEGWARQREIATNEDYPVYLCFLADVLTALGRAHEAVVRIQRELDGFERSQLRIWLPELERVLGDAILAADPQSTEQARHHYVRAADLAAFQKVPMLQLRIAMSEARLHASSAPEQAGRLLASALAKLPAEAGTEDAIDLAEASALAAQLGASRG
jgi:class 3 adenylate cyclase/predicted ATPase